MVRRVDEFFEYLVLADSVLVIADTHGRVEVICDDREATTGAQYRSEMDGTPADTAEHALARDRYVSQLLAHRNREGGFWVAAADPTAVRHALTGKRPVNTTSALALLSDGASRTVDRFHLSTWDQLTNTLAAQGPAFVIREVRAAEHSDPRGDRWPRGKSADDATIAYLEPLPTI
jgi:hypothetical protein